MKSSSKKMETVSQYLNWARTEGFTHDFSVRDNKLCAPECKKKYSAKDAKIVGFLRFEGESDPGDNSVAYMIETSDGVKGTLVDAYGMYADEGISKFLKSVYQDIRYNPEVQSGAA
jgi:hypothetical protein